MKFFISHTIDEKQAEDVYQGIKMFLKDQGWHTTDCRIFSLRYTHYNKKYHSQVDQLDDRVNQEIVAILEAFFGESFMYLVCTGNYGVYRGSPVMVGKEEVKEILDFE